MREWKWQGHAGHFCMAEQCRWHMNTVVGNGAWLVSSVGDLWVDGEREPVGLHPNCYETMVFPAAPPLECGCVEMTEPTEETGEKYETCAQAIAGHLALCEKYDSMEAAR